MCVSVCTEYTNEIWHPKHFNYARLICVYMGGMVIKYCLRECIKAWHQSTHTKTHVWIVGDKVNMNNEQLKSWQMDF